MRSLAKSLAAAILPLVVVAAPGVAVSVADAHAGSLGMPDAACVPLDAFAVKTLRDGVKHDYRPSDAGCSLALDVASCAPPVRPSEIVYALGYGHSFGCSRASDQSPACRCANHLTGWPALCESETRLLEDTWLR